MSVETAVPDELLTDKELAKRLRMHPVSVRVMANKGDLPAVRVGKRVRFDWLEVLKHLKAVRLVQETGAVQG